MLRSDANYAKDHITQRTVHSRNKGILLKRRITHSLEHPINLQDNIEQQGQDSTNATMEILPSTDAAIRNQGASIKTLEIQNGQMSKVLQERGVRVPFPRRLQNYYCDDWREAQDVKILEAYDHTLPQKEKDPGIFTLPCFIHNVCFDKALVDLGASVSVMPFSTYTNLGLGILSHTRLTIEMADRTIKQPRGIAENVLVRIGKFIFPIDFIILDIPEDDDVPLILGRPFLSTAHSKIDVYKRKITLRVGEEKLVFKSIKPATSLIRRVFMLKSLETKLIVEDNESFDPLYGNYIELNDLDTPLEPETIQDVNFEPTFVNKPEISSKCYYKIKFSCTIGYKNVNADFIPSLSVNLITKSFYYSIIKDKDDHEGKSPVGTLIDMPIFVGKFSILTGFIIVDNNDDLAIRKIDDMGMIRRAENAVSSKPKNILLVGTRVPMLSTLKDIASKIPMQKIPIHSLKFFGCHTQSLPPTRSYCDQSDQNSLEALFSENIFLFRNPTSEPSSVD
ncbi:ribonuclease H-like domain-containing protein [Tanacetum coccineum]